MADRKQLTDIQALRGVAILMVLCAHLSLPATLLNLAPVRISNPFWPGVELFFVISGYVVSRSVLLGSLDPLAFLIRRVFRLWPAIFVFILLSAAVSVLIRYATEIDAFGRTSATLDIGQFLVQSAANMFGFLINLTYSSVGYLNGAMWSLSVEFQFYYCFAVALIILYVSRFGRIMSVNFILILCVVLYCVATTDRILLFSGSAMHFGGHALTYIISYRFDFMILGVIGFIMSDKYPLPATVIVWGPSVTVWLLATSMGFVVVSEPPLSAGAHPVLDGLTLPLMALAYMGVVLCGSRNAAFPATHGRAYKILLWIGDRSFSIYLFHFPIMALGWVFWDLFFRFLPPFLTSDLGYGSLQAIFVLIITFFGAALSYQWVERPWTKFGSSLAKRTNFPGVASWIMTKLTVWRQTLKSGSSIRLSGLGRVYRVCRLLRSRWRCSVAGGN